METSEQAASAQAPQTSKALEWFAFLIGKWRFEARFKSENGATSTFHGTWVGRGILDGQVIEDEYRMLGPGGELLVLGMNYRVYDRARQLWHIKWLNALDGTWTDLTPEDLGGVKLEGQSLSYMFREQAGATQGWRESLTRATYTSVSPDLFYWRGAKSKDRVTWHEFMVVECHRDA
ncbi:MAG TPA: hypothetical protein VIE16_01710 [Phenylobacterium sp.]|jgi:hypothetical protein